VAVGKTAFGLGWHTRRNQISSFARNETSPFKSAGGRQFLAAEVCASAVVMLDTPCSEVVWRVLATHSIRQFPPSIPLPCGTVCHHISAGVYIVNLKLLYFCSNYLQQLFGLYVFMPVVVYNWLFYWGGNFCAVVIILFNLWFLTQVTLSTVDCNLIIIK